MESQTTKKVLLAVAAALLLTWGLGASTTDPTKIGVVDLEQAMFSTNAGKAARDELERKQRDAEQSIQPMVQRFEEMKKEYQAKQFVLSDDARTQKEFDLKDLQQEIETKSKTLEAKLKLSHERVLGPLQHKVIEVVQSIGRDEGYSFIMHRGTPGILYTREALDITDAVIETFNKKG